jgi:hypothetical protein
MRPQAKMHLVVQDPHLAVVRPSNPIKSLTSRGEQPECGAQRRHPPRTRVAVEAQLRDKTIFSRQDREISFQVPGPSQMSSPSTLAP